MKRLLLLRHGKTEERAKGGDQARALTARGQRDVPEAARWVRAQDVQPDMVITSDARRAVQTAHLAAAVLGLAERIHLEPQIYGAESETLFTLVHGLPDTAACVLLVGHNPGFEQLAGDLARPGTAPDHLATAGVAQIDFAVEHWRDVTPGTGTIHIFAPTSRD